MKHTHIAGFAASVALLVAVGAEARVWHVQGVPNATNVGTHSTCGLCHVSGGDSPLNPFGQDVSVALADPLDKSEDFWTPALAALDSDGDGYSNGDELQDPTGTWAGGDPDPGVLVAITHPGVAADNFARRQAALRGEYNLDGQGVFAPMPAHIAVETIPDAPFGADHHDIRVGAMFWSITSLVRLEEDSGKHLRVDMDGMVFRALRELRSGFTLAHGGNGTSGAIFSIDREIEPNTRIALNVTDALAVLDRTQGGLRASITVYNGLGDALSEENPIVLGAAPGSAVVIRKVTGLSAKVSPGTAVADAGTRYLRFVGDEDGPVSASVLGNARVGVRSAVPVLLSAATGLPLHIDDLVGADGVSVLLRGDMTIGAFSLVQPEADGNVACPDATGTVGAPGRGNLNVSPAGDAATLSGVPSGAYFLCVEVDRRGLNEMALAPQTYTATLLVREADGDREVASGVIGIIARDGTRVLLTHMLAEPGYSTEIMVVNRGYADAPYRVEGAYFVAGGAGNLTDYADGIIPARRHLVLRANDLFEFERQTPLIAAATLLVDASPRDVSVTATILNPVAGSTDTVRYASTYAVTSP